MTDPDKPTSATTAESNEPPRSRLRQILDERPEARPRLGRAVAELLGTTLVAVVALGVLLIWHLVRRAHDPRAVASTPRGRVARLSR